MIAPYATDVSLMIHWKPGIVPTWSHEKEDWHTNWNKRTDDTEKLNDKMVMGERMRTQERERVWKGAQTVRTVLQTIETIIAHRRRRWWIKRGTISAPLYLLSLIFSSLLFFLPSLYHCLPITTPSEHFPLPSPSYRNTFRVYFAF